MNKTELVNAVAAKDIDKKAAKAAEKEVAQKAPQKVNPEPQKQAGGGPGLSL